MKNAKIIFTLLLIALLVVVSSCGKKAEEEPKSLVEEKSTEIEKEETVIPEPEQPAVVEEVKKKEVKPEKPVDTGAKVFEVQVLSLTDRYSVELQQEAMLKKGVRTYISEYIKDGEKYYRLRLEGKYSRHGAEEIGEKVKRDFWGIIDYWIVKTG
ncbi:MAG: hypothetical protein RAO94_09785 [Candidatus Stygibacter australis]|nr:hypothetical protein [Candidatus Stygibacter australis]